MRPASFRGTKRIWAAQELGLEGLIGKRRGSRYEAGKRSGAWVKIKLYQEQTFVIGGYTEPEGSRKHFGALLTDPLLTRAKSKAISVFRLTVSGKAAPESLLVNEQLSLP